MPARILSTKKLRPNQKQFLLNAGLSLVEADFIGIQHKKVNIDKVGDFLIFTSSNAVNSVVLQENFFRLRDKPCYCVGQKTRFLLESHGFKVVGNAGYAAELAEILKEQKHASFTFFSGNLRLETLPLSMKISGIEFNEVVVYETVPTPKQIKTILNGIMFFSPSAVESYITANRITDETCFCIGTTTAKALENTSGNIVIATKPTVENVIIQCINHYKTFNVA